jgi:hypothetical protein
MHIFSEQWSFNLYSCKSVICDMISCIFKIKKLLLKVLTVLETKILLVIKIRAKNKI